MVNYPGLLLSVHDQHAQNMLKGIKTLELRKVVPKKLQSEGAIYLYSCGQLGQKRIIGKVTKSAFILNLTDTEAMELCPSLIEAEAEAACVTMEKLMAYAPCHGIHVQNPVTFLHSVGLDSIGLNRPPQSWQYLSKRQCEAIERMAKGDKDTTCRTCAHCHAGIIKPSPFSDDEVPGHYCANPPGTKTMLVSEINGCCMEHKPKQKEGKQRHDS